SIPAKAVCTCKWTQADRRKSCLDLGNNHRVVRPADRTLVNKTGGTTWCRMRRRQPSKARTANAAIGPWVARATSTWSRAWRACRHDRPSTDTATHDTERLRIKRGWHICLRLQGPEVPSSPPRGKGDIAVNDLTPDQASTRVAELRANLNDPAKI